MGGSCNRLFGLLLRAADHTTVVRSGEQSDDKPKIYISAEVSAREKAAIVNALKCSVLVSRAEYSGELTIRTIPRIIIADDGFNTEWLHGALKLLKSGISVLVFSTGSGGCCDAVLLSLLSGAEIVPLYSKTRRRLIKQHHITFGAPISAGIGNALSAEWVNSEIERVNTAISAVREG